MTTGRHLIALACAGFILALSAGSCNSVKSKYESTRGIRHVLLEDDLEDCTKTVVKVLEKQIKLTGVTARADAVQSIIRAQDAQDRAVTVELKRVSDKMTNMTVTVGSFGDEAMVNLIVEKVKAAL